MTSPSTPPRARVTSSVGARPIDRSSTSPTGTARSRRACRASRASPAVRTTTTCCRFGRKASISRSSTPARGSSAKRLTGWCCARRRGEGSRAARPSLDHQMAGAPLRRRAEGGHEHLDLRRLRVGGPAIGADVRRAARVLPRKVVQCDIHCVTRWSRLDNTFEGVAVQLLLERAGVKPDAHYCLVSAEQGFTTNLPLTDLDRPDNLVAFKWNGEWLMPEHGGPARLLVPHLYVWKSAKWVRGFTLVDQDVPGFWEQNGYHMRGEI